MCVLDNQTPKRGPLAERICIAETNDGYGRPRGLVCCASFYAGSRLRVGVWLAQALPSPAALAYTRPVKMAVVSLAATITMHEPTAATPRASWDAGKISTPLRRQLVQAGSARTAAIAGTLARGHRHPVGTHVGDGGAHVSSSAADGLAAARTHTGTHVPAHMRARASLENEAGRRLPPTTPAGSKNSAVNAHARGKSPQPQGTRELSPTSHAEKPAVKAANLAHMQLPSMMEARVSSSLRKGVEYLKRRCVCGFKLLHLVM